MPTAAMVFWGHSFHYLWLSVTLSSANQCLPDSLWFTLLYPLILCPAFFLRPYATLCCRNKCLLKSMSDQVPSPLLLPPGYHSTSTFNFFRAISLKELTVLYTGPSLSTTSQRKKELTVLYHFFCMLFDFQWPSSGSLWMENSCPSFCNWLSHLMTLGYQPDPLDATFYDHCSL